MKKKATSSIFTLWEKAKAKKADLASTPNPPPVEIENNLQIALVQAQDDDEALAQSAIEANDEAPQSDRGSPTPIGEDGADLEALEHDPGKRIAISRYAVNDQDRVRRRYIELGPCQSKNHDFPYRDISGHPRRFCPVWFKQNKWLEYSVERDAAFCFVCYLFKDKRKCPGGDTFVKGGWRNWHLKSRLKKHMGTVSSAHAEAQEKYDRFTTPRTSIRESIASNTTQYKALYKLRLTWTLKCLRFLLRQGLAFRGHDESEDSLNKGNFLELLNWLAGNFEEVDRVVLKNAPQNCKMTCHQVQHDLIKCCAQETTKLVIEELGGQNFAILADESADVYHNEQLAVCLRYVDKKGRAVERFLGVAHVEDTSAMTLKAAVEHMLMKYNLTFAMVRGQGYDGASNMKGNANGLKKLIMDESPYAYYVHCFAHQLQLTLVAVAKESGDCTWFFGQLVILLNVLGNSCKKMRMLRMAQVEELIDALELEEEETGKGLNQEMGLGRPCDTRWGSHYKTVMHVISMYPAIRRVLVKIGKEYTTAEAQSAMTMLTSFRSFEFVFMAHLMQEIFGYTEDLSRALQKKDQDIVNAMELVDLTKFHLQCLREEEGWNNFLQRVTSFCVKYKIKVVDMEGSYYPVGRPKRGFYNGAMNYHRFHVDMFVSVIDRQLRELNDRFDEVNTELLFCMAAFSPLDSFAAYDQAKLVTLATKFYPKDFTTEELGKLPWQLNMYISHVRRDERFKNLKNLCELSVKLVNTQKDEQYYVVYKLLKLVLILPVATASVERVFSTLNYVKNKQRNKMGDEYLNNCLVTFNEREFFSQVKDEDIINLFQQGDRRVIL
ncbi:hypothetical protein PVAP13_6KG086376 [Panicum virgatum]|uniref:TTF-type domain-containing protein n=1 Tax=Panicum virgatum TaxID=38727 RepID=A0A8T0R6H1_PANVG|nr:hypothetical protein PVAP13_6KG086376 [Panicum virgatum]